MVLFVNILVALASILVISISAKYAIAAICRYAETTGISKYLIGFLIVSIGTSMPELSTAIVGSLAGQGTLLLGDIIGANILVVTLILGITAFVGKSIKIKSRTPDKTILTMMGMVILPLLLGIDGTFSRLDGGILLGAFILYVYSLLKKEKTLGKIKEKVPVKQIVSDMVVFLGSIIALLLSARWLLISSLHISMEFNIPVFVMGLFFLAIGTTVPELTISIKSVLSGVSSIAFGDLLGAVVINSTFVLGIGSLINPITFKSSSFIVAGLFMVTSFLIAILFLNKKELNWRDGIGLCMIYLTFVITQILALP